MVDSARRRVLIVDDEPLVLEILSEHFEIDYDVEIALNGVDALNAVRRQRPDVVLLDVKMPGMSGVEVLKAIKQLDDSIAVIMVTANEQVSLAGSYSLSTLGLAVREWYRPCSDGAACE